MKRQHCDFSHFQRRKHWQCWLPVSKHFLLQYVSFKLTGRNGGQGIWKVSSYSTWSGPLLTFFNVLAFLWNEVTPACPLHRVACAVYNYIMTRTHNCKPQPESQGPLHCQAAQSSQHCFHLAPLRTASQSPSQEPCHQPGQGSCNKE